MTDLSEDALWDALDGLHAYDTGAVSSGIRDEVLRAKAKEQLRSMLPKYRAAFFASRFRDHYLSDEAIAQGYGLEDAAGFWRWLDEDMNCAL